MEKGNASLSTPVEILRAEAEEAVAAYKADPSEVKRITLARTLRFYAVVIKPHQIEEALWCAEMEELCS